ncbi:hypothetical protein Kpho02_14550 [Kitasatospora phosalacinea]|uniref:Uncharacterized protein n=1 Tax=Kitasatospora phosalacinea TaxID=2065 RepID=A0A9W6Q630_9ACTN|nr:hypothetical protein [Kitasatospora phosalacinea]GLW69156.1 hypothetical protein Kpho02_14550 [Kitasatospora phosalacinea]
MTRTEPVPNLPDERLCWLAVREQLGRKAARPGVFGWLSALLAFKGGPLGRQSAGLAGDLRRDLASGRLHEYAFAVDGAAETLTAAERAHLRATGEVPDGFLAEVERRVAERRGKR